MAGDDARCWRACTSPFVQRLFCILAEKARDCGKRRMAMLRLPLKTSSKTQAIGYAGKMQVLTLLG